MVLKEGSSLTLQENRLYSGDGRLLNLFPSLAKKAPAKGCLPDIDPSQLTIQDHTLYNLPSPCDTLRLPPGVCFIARDAFFYHVPRRIEASTLPLPRKEVSFEHQEEVRQLMITDPEASLDLDRLRGWTGLSEIFPSGNIAYSEKDGMLFPKDMTSLLFLPPCHPQIVDGSFQVPEGVLDLGDQLFEKMPRLKRVMMPDCVTSVGNRLFQGCEDLEYVWMSDFISQFPVTLSSQRGEAAPSGSSYVPASSRPIDASGLFCDCPSLSFVHLPKSIHSLGSYTFSNCGLTSLPFLRDYRISGRGPFGNRSLFPSPFPME